MEHWWRTAARFTARLLAIEAAVCLLCAGLASWGVLDLPTALVIVGLAVGALGVMPLFLGTPTTGMVFLNGMQNFQAFNLLSEWGSEMPPGGADSILHRDMERANHAIPRGILLIAAAALSLVVAYVVTLL